MRTGAALMYRHVMCLTVLFIIMSFGAIFGIAKVFGLGWSWPSALAISICGQGINAVAQLHKIRKQRTRAHS
jgi:hypothetical protein